MKVCVYCVQMLYVMCVWKHSPRQWWDEKCVLYQFVFGHLHITGSAILHSEVEFKGSTKVLPNPPLDTIL